MEFNPNPVPAPPEQPPPVPQPPIQPPPPQNPSPPQEPPPITVKPTAEEQQLSAMDFIVSVIERNGFKPGDVTNYSFKITSLDKAPEKKHLQGTVVREIVCTSDGRTQKIIIEQKINVSIAAPDPRRSDSRTITETKMRALYAIDGHESKLQEAFNRTKNEPIDKKIAELRNQKIMKIVFHRAPKSHGFYGTAIRWEKSPPPKGIVNRIAHTFASKGSIEGVFINNKYVTSYTKQKRLTFRNMPFPLVDKRAEQVKKIVNEAYNLISDPKFLKDIEENPGSDNKKKLDLLKQKLQAGSDRMTANEVLCTIEREIANRTDELTLQLTADRWDNINIGHTQSVVSHNDKGASFGRNSRDMLKQLSQIDQMIASLGENPPEKQLKPYLDARKRAENHFTSKLMLHHLALKDIDKQIRAMEFLISCCSEMMTSENLNIHKKNHEYLQGIIKKQNIHERAENYKADVFKAAGKEFFKYIEPVRRDQAPPPEPPQERDAPPPRTTPNDVSDVELEPVPQVEGSAQNLQDTN